MADISLLPKEYSIDKTTASKEGRLFSVASFAIFFIVLAIWGGLYFYNNQTGGEIAKLRDQTSAMSLGDRSAKIAKIEEANKILDIFSGILKNHTYSSNVFAAIESATLKKVYFNDFSVDVKKGSVVLRGMTDSYATFSKQYNKFNEGSDTITGAEINSIDRAKDGTTFGMTVSLASSLFLKK